jgi:hypothetical protein
MRAIDRCARRLDPSTALGILALGRPPWCVEWLRGHAATYTELDFEPIGDRSPA